MALVYSPNRTALGQMARYRLWGASTRFYKVQWVAEVCGVEVELGPWVFGLTTLSGALQGCNKRSVISFNKHHALMHARQMLQDAAPRMVPSTAGQRSTLTELRQAAGLQAYQGPDWRWETLWRLPLRANCSAQAVLVNLGCVIHRPAEPLVSTSAGPALQRWWYHSLSLFRKQDNWLT